MIELVVAMSVMLITLSAMLVVFTTGLLTASRSEQRATASFIADAQMEAYTGMVSRDIGIDLSSTKTAALDSTYKSDSACANGTATCSVTGVSATETGPTGATPNSCTTINTWYSTATPCDES